MRRLLLASIVVATTAIPVALVGGCSSTETKPPNGPNAGGDQRDTEMVHEDCDLQSSDAKGLDANGDGKPDIIKVFSGGREVCRAVDINMDRMIDVFVYFDDAGQVRRRESGFDRDTQPDEISYYQGGQLIRKERETNNDRKIDTWSYFTAGRLVKEERDSTGDGYVDQWWTFNRPDQPQCAIVLTDADGDGQPDKDSEIDTCGKNLPKPPAAPAATMAASAEPSAAPAPDPPPPLDPQPEPSSAPDDKKDGP